MVERLTERYAGNIRGNLWCFDRATQALLFEVPSILLERDDGDILDPATKTAPARSTNHIFEESNAIE